MPTVPDNSTPKGQETEYVYFEDAKQMNEKLSLGKIGKFILRVF
jgi:hypothetical protein